MIESGAIVSLGLVMWFSKCSWRMRMWMLSHPLAIDILVFTFLTLIHWGTFSGVMAATVGAVMCSLLLSAGRKVFGYNAPAIGKQGKPGYVPAKYVRGYYDVSDKLIEGAVPA